MGPWAQACYLFEMHDGFEMTVYHDMDPLIVVRAVFHVHIQVVAKCTENHAGSMQVMSS